MANIVEQLLKFKPEEIKKPTKTIQLPLVKLGGAVFDFPIQSVDAKYKSELQEESMDISMENEEMDIKIRNTYEVMVKTIIAGCPEVFQNGSVREHFGAKTNKQLVEILLEEGEMNTLKKEIDKLSKSEMKITTIEEDDLKNS